MPQKNANEPLVSIIVPVYNASYEQLQRTFASIVAQTYASYELIVVDDGSDENTASNLVTLLGTIPNSMLVRQHNKGVSAARNNGLEHAKGEYIAFADAGDTVSPEFIHEALDLLTRHELDLVVGGILLRKPSGDQQATIQLQTTDIAVYEADSIAPLLARCMSFKQVPSATELDNVEIAGAYSKLFKRDLVENIHFIEALPLYEDIIFSIETFEQAAHLGITDRIWYDYYQEAGSASHRFQPSLANDSAFYIAWLTRNVSTQRPQLLPWVYRTSVIWLNNYLNNLIKYDIPNRKENLAATLENEPWRKNIILALSTNTLSFKEYASARLVKHSRLGILLWLAKMNLGTKNRRHHRNDLYE